MDTVHYEKEDMSADGIPSLAFFLLLLVDNFHRIVEGKILVEAGIGRDTQTIHEPHIPGVAFPAHIHHTHVARSIHHEDDAVEGGLDNHLPSYEDHCVRGCLRNSAGGNHHLRLLRGTLVSETCYRTLDQHVLVVVVVV